ncbi:MAG: type II toxin-antitoxin system RelE/ParE family toxin [Pseudomonadota bacterium]
MLDQLDWIARQPLLYPFYDHDLIYRLCVYHSDVIYYRERLDGVEIMAVLGQQDRDQWL